MALQVELFLQFDAPSTSKLKKALEKQEKLASNLHRQLGA